MAVWLADDDYDHDDDPQTISATTLLRPMKAIILAMQNNMLDKEGDVVSMAASRIGTAMHDAIERTWRKKRSTVEGLLTILGVPARVAKKVIVDPTEAELDDGCIPVYMERRSYKQVGAYKVSGKFDFIMDGKLEDFKSTGTYTYEKQTNAKKYAQQGSIYKWLNPDIITDNIMTICYFFFDWKANKAYDKNYPSSKVMGQNFVLDSPENTQKFVEQQIATIERLKNAPQDDLPACTPEELWQGSGTWKYYKKPGAVRSTKNFDNSAEAYERLALEGNVGEVIHIPDTPRACSYCDVNTICVQGINNLARLKNK